MRVCVRERVRVCTCARASLFVGTMIHQIADRSSKFLQ